MKKIILNIAAAIVLGSALIAIPSVRADDSTAPAAPTKAKGGEKFYGPVTAVDTNAMTFTVNDLVMTVTKDSQLTKGTNSATLGDAVVGEPARGSYIKGTDGKLEITKVRFGKKVGGKAGGKAGGKKKQDAGSDSSTSTPAPAPQN
jgi:hypothetical protein